MGEWYVYGLAEFRGILVFNTYLKNNLIPSPCVRQTCSAGFLCRSIFVIISVFLLFVLPQIVELFPTLLDRWLYVLAVCAGNAEKREMLIP